MSTLTRDSSKSAINQANLTLRSQPWYQQWFQRQGLNPNQVQLSGAQRQELEALSAQHGMPLHENRMEIDPAGNINTQHGFRSQPTWLKALEIGAAGVAGGYLAAPYLAGAGGAIGGGSGGVSAGAGAGVASGATAGTAGGFGVGSALMGLTPTIVGTVGSLYSQHAQNSANRDAAQISAQANTDALQFQREQLAQQQKQFDETQARNYGLYQEQNTYDRGLNAQRQARLAPYQQMGVGTLGQLTRPPQRMGTVRDLMGGK